MSLDLQCHYDDGYFDKDEQGWVTNGTGVSTDAATGEIRVRRWGDRNGLDPWEEVFVTRVAAVFEELKLVKLEQPHWYFNLETRRLFSGNADVVLHRRPAPAGFLEPAAVERAVALVFELVRAVGGPSLARPPVPPWPARGSDVTRFTFSEVKVPLAADMVLELGRRPAYDEGMSEELRLSLRGSAYGAGFVVTERGELVISVRGGPEHHPALKQRLDAW